MNINFRVITIAFFFLTVFSVNGQTNENENKYENIFTGILNFNNWIGKLDSEFKKLIVEEKREEFIRKLGYIGSDLQYIARKKQDFLLNIENENFDSSNKEISLIQLSTNDLLINIGGLNVLINDNLGKIGNDSLQILEMELIHEKRKMHSSMLKSLEKKELNDLISESKTGIELLKKSKNLVWALREDIMKNQK